MPISYDDAYAQTNPNASDEQRDQAAKNIIAGTAASEAYWSSRGTLEALQAQADGHGVVVRNTQGESSAVTTSDSAPVIEGSAVEETAPAIDPATETDAQKSDKLREQLRAAGITPQA